MFIERFSTLQENPKEFSLFPAADNCSEWDALPEAARTKLIGRGKAASESPYPTLSASDYLDFTRTGRRIPFEERYFARRHLLNDLVMAECADGGGRLLHAIIDGVWAICEESGWQLPAHNTYVRDAVQIPLPDSSRPVLDLFACETAAALALIYHLLGEQLENEAPGIKTRILMELERRIITPYLTEHFWWMGHSDESMCNWTPWCTQNVLIVAALIPQAEQIRHAVCKKAVSSLDFFLKDYGEDGCCDEGAKYYSHAALCLFAAVDVLNSMTGGHFSPLYKTQKIRNMADYIRQMHVAGDYYINFADCPAILEPPGALEFLFGKSTENPDLCAFAAEGMYRRGIYEPSDDLSLYTRLASLFSMAEISRYNKKPTLPRDKYFASVGILIARDSRICLAVKSGDNNDNHNHNDTGSITIYFDGKPFLIDVGVESYTRETFSPQRYSIWTMQSAYHNLPAFAGIMQKAGAQYKAQDVQYQIGDDQTAISMDISGAYPPEAGVVRYLRHVRLKKNVGVYVTDEYAGEHPAELSLIFCRRPIVSARCIQVPNSGQIAIKGAANIRVEDIDITDPVLQKVWGRELFRVLATFSQRLDLEILP